MIDIEKLAKETGFIPSAYADGECYADLETLKQFAEAYAAEKQRQQEPVAKINAQWSCPDSLGKKYRERYVQFKNGIIPQEGIELFTYPPDAAKVLEDKEREIAELKEMLKDRQTDLDYEFNRAEQNECEVNALKDHINDLRDAAENYILEGESTLPALEKALSKTPAQSLQSVINETIEECAKVCDEHGAIFVAKSIRALKATI